MSPRQPSQVSSPAIIPLVDAGLGNSAYLVDLGDGRALAVDPSRDLRALHRAAAQHRLTVTFSAETHLHADFLTGSLQLAADHDVTILGSAAGGRTFDHRGLGDGDEVDLGGLTLRALATPGHTPEHLSFLLLDGDAPQVVFTGGSLIVGAAARTDLSGADRTEALARAQYRSLHRLIGELPDDTPVLPTHGAGSFCSAPPGAARTTTIGAERASNALLAAPTEDAFVAQLLASLGTYPAYFDRLGELNRRGPAVLRAAPVLAPLLPSDVTRLLADGAQVLDVRPYVDFAAGHVAGSLSIVLRDAFATWLGWLVDPARRLIVVRAPDQDADEVLWQALKVGVEGIVGELAGGVDAWRAAGGVTRAMPVITAAEVEPDHLVDVRQGNEYAAGHIPGAQHTELADVVNGAPRERVQVMCGHGERATTGASLLAAAGWPDVTIVAGSAQDWAQAHDEALEVGV